MMRLLRLRESRILAVAWVLGTVPFATNIVREHYPAFSLLDGTGLKVDRYQGFHSDIFEHTDGHSYVGNNVAVSLLAAVPLLVFDPALDALEDYSLRRLGNPDLRPEGVYRTDKPNRVAFFSAVTEQGLDLRFGAAAFITTAFFMAPFTALIIVLMYKVLRQRGVTQRRATWLAFLFGFGTPVFFRSLHLNHNLFLMYALFGAFYLLWQPDAPGTDISWGRRFTAGALCGFCLAADYAGAVLLLITFGYLILKEAQTRSWIPVLRRTVPFVLGSIPPVVVLWYTQWVMYGDPFLPGQYWMPDVNFTDQGWRGFSAPTLDLYFLNLFAPSYGMFVFGPLLALGFIPMRQRDRLLPGLERLFVWVLLVGFLTFCAANQYSRMQFNSGFRYLIPLVPFVFLLAADHLSRWPERWLWVVTGVVCLHSWVLAVFREPVHVSWSLFFQEGLTLPWLRVLRMTSDPSGPTHHPLIPVLVYGLTAVAVAAAWRFRAGGPHAGVSSA